MATANLDSIVVPPLPRVDAFKRMGYANGFSDLKVTYAWFNGVNRVIDSIGTLSFYANANSVLAYAQANVARQTANAAYGEANLAYSVATSAYSQANIATLFAEESYAQANIALLVAENAYDAANAAANTVAVSNNGTLVLAAANLDFLGTATVNVSVDANGTTQTNIAYTANTTAIAGPAYDHANLAYNVAQTANTTANLALPIAGGTITGNLTVLQDVFIDGDLIVTGNLVIGNNLTVSGYMNVASIIGLMSINQS